MQTPLRIAILVLLTATSGDEKPSADKPDLTWHGCEQIRAASNFAGYQSTARIYSCKEGVLRIEGRWGIDIQNGWQYHTEFGALSDSGEYVGDLPESTQRPSFQKWCRTRYGWTLCGWNEQEDRKQQELRKIHSHHKPDWKKPT